MTASAQILGYDLAPLPDTASAYRAWWDEDQQKMRWEEINPRDLYV